jgi:hypothetical protein
MNKQTITALKTGWNMRDKVNGEEFSDLLELRRLNERDSAAWIRENNRDLPKEKRDKATRTMENIGPKATAICKAHGWTLSAPGLWWEIRDGNGNDLTIRL